MKEFLLIDPRGGATAHGTSQEAEDSIDKNVIVGVWTIYKLVKSATVEVMASKLTSHEPEAA